MILDGCIPYQLYKDDYTSHENAIIHRYGLQQSFGFWEIDYIGPLITSNHRNEYLLMAIDYTTSRAIAWPLEARSADSAAEMVEYIV
jgi:hypothetical protein